MGSELQEPTIMVGGNGKSLEIFVFSNGQQDSPPRKYNLSLNERWNATLNFLARSQYGSKQTIELYTIEGRKVEGPLELSDGAAYVAVEPPQAFASAGYHEYLMKASRSREKRQERITEKESLIKTVKLNIEDKNEERYNNATNKKYIEGLAIVSTNAAEEQGAITDKVKSDIPRAVRPIRRISSVKPPQKRNSYLPQHNPPIIRKKASNVTTPVVKKANNTSSVGVIKKKFETASTKNSKPTISLGIKNRPNNDKTSGAQLASYKEHTESSDLQNEIDFAHIPDRTFAGLKEKQNFTVDSSTSTSAVIIERHTLLPVSVNRESEVIYLNERLSSAGTFHNRINDVDMSSKDEGCLRDRINSTANLLVGPSKPKLITKVLEECSQNETLLFGNQTGDNHFSIYVKKGDMVNLKLNIEVKNGSNAVIEKDHTHHLKASSFVSTSKSDRGTLAINTAVTTNGCEAPVLKNSYLDGLPLEQLQQITNELKVAVCGINCCPCPGMPERGAPVYVDNNNYIILLPPDTQVEKSIKTPGLCNCSCTCKLETYQKSSIDVPDYQVLRRSKSNIVTLEEDKSAFTDIKANDVTTVPEQCKNGTDTTEPNESQLLTKKVSRLEIEANQICDCCETCKVLNLPPACNCAQNLIPESPDCEKERPVPTDFVVQQHLSANSNFVIFKEAFTQTDWNSLVMEARPRGDGSYAFHLPSLEVLKLCNVLY